MKEIIVFMVLALISYVFRLLFISLAKDEFKDKKETNGVITRVFQSEYGNIQYYVSFVTDDGTQMEGESVYYSSTKVKYDKGDSVTIKYLIIREGCAQVAVVDNELVPCRDSFKTYANNLLLASVVFIIIAAIFFVKNILL